MVALGRLFYFFLYIFTAASTGVDGRLDASAPVSFFMLLLTMCRLLSGLVMCLEWVTVGI